MKKETRDFTNGIISIISAGATVRVEVEAGKPDRWELIPTDRQSHGGFYQMNEYNHRGWKEQFQAMIAAGTVTMEFIDETNIREAAYISARKRESGRIYTAKRYEVQFA